MPTGLFVKLPAAEAIDVAAAAGLDTVIVDLEHGPPDASELAHALRAAGAAGVRALVRVPEPLTAWIPTALDLGADGVVLPHVVSAEQAARAVAAARYPPVGQRGLALSTRAGRHGASTVAAHLRAAEATEVIVQIEDVEGLEAASAITAVPGVTGTLIGTTDLSLALGHPGEPAAPAVMAAVDRILAAARAAGVPVAAVATGAADARAWRERGAQLVVFVGSAVLRDALARLQRDAPATPDPTLPLVLLPGMLGDATVWQPVADRLERRSLDGRIDLDESVAELAAGVLATAPPRFVLAGHSLGGVVALAAACRAPERVAGLVLVAANARAPSDAQRAEWDALRAEVLAGGFDAIAQRQADDVLPPGAPDALRAHVTRMARTCGPDVLLRQLAAQASRQDLRPALAGVDCEALVVAGEHDRVSPPELQSELAAALPRARLVTLPTGHTVPLEAPAELAAAIRDWLGPAA